MGVIKGGVVSSLELLYAVLKLFHSQLESKLLTQQLLAKYLQLLAMLLNTTPIEHMLSHDSDDEYDFDDVMSIDGDDPLSSQEELLRSCLFIISEDGVVRRLQKEVREGVSEETSFQMDVKVGTNVETYFETEVMEALSALCFQLISHSGSHTAYTYKKTKLFQKLSLVPSLLKPLWENVTQLSIQRSFG